MRKGFNKKTIYVIKTINFIGVFDYFYCIYSKFDFIFEKKKKYTQNLLTSMMTIFSLKKFEKLNILKIF